MPASPFAGGRFGFDRLPTLRATLLLIIPALVACLGLAFYLFSGRYVSTDNAYIGAQKVLITPEVSGKVVSIAVQEGQLLKRGDELFAIDAVPYRLAAQEAEAKLARVKTDFENLKSNYASLGKQIELSRQALDAAQSDYDRKLALLNNRISTPSDVDRSRAALVIAKAQLEQLQQQEAGARIQLLGDPALPLERFPQYVEALATLDRARRDLENTTLRAPIAGVATQVTSIQMGRYLVAGAAVFSIIDSANVWIDANPKETDLTYVRPGQTAAITIETYPDESWDSAVASIRPASGAEFALLPPQNSTGNWVKVVQRITVRLAIRPVADQPPLRAGMSAVVTIDTGHHRQLPGLVESALAWVGAGS